LPAHFASSLVRGPYCAHGSTSCSARGTIGRSVNTSRLAHTSTNGSIASGNQSIGERGSPGKNALNSVSSKSLKALGSFVEIHSRTRSGTVPKSTPNSNGLGTKSTLSSVKNDQYKSLRHLGNSWYRGSSRLIRYMTTLGSVTDTRPIMVYRTGSFRNSRAILSGPCKVALKKAFTWFA